MVQIHVDAVAGEDDRRTVLRRNLRASGVAMPTAPSALDDFFAPARSMADAGRDLLLPE